MAGWVSIDEIREWWRDAPYDDELLQLLLDVAQQQVLAYGPARIADDITADPDTVPDNYRLAQFNQTRNLWNSARVDPANQGIGVPDFTIPAYPLDWVIKAIIRPKRAKPTVA